MTARAHRSALPAGSESGFALIFAADERYAPWLAVAMRSALTNLASNVDPELWVLGNDLAESSRDRLANVVTATRPATEIQWMQIPGTRLGPVATGSHLTQAAYSRLLIPDVLPTHIRRAVYLDVDVLVRTDLSPLFMLELGGAPVGTVRDFLITSTDHRISGLRGRRLARPYFNTGVLVIDVGQWRREALAERALAYAATSPEPLRWADQDALNAVVESWYELDFRWNVQPSPGNLFAGTGQPRTDIQVRLHHERGELNRATYRDANVLHFAGPVKPWQPRCTTRGTAAWVRAMLRSGWFTPQEAATWLLRRHRARLRYRVGTTRRRGREFVRRADT